MPKRSRATPPNLTIPMQTAPRSTRAHPNPSPADPPSTPRAGFTLIELMVVIAIIIALASIALLFNPRREARLAFQAADQLQTYFASARSRALRDQAPRGLRLIPTNGVYNSLQLIETPEPLSLGVFMRVEKRDPVGSPTDPDLPRRSATFEGYNVNNTNPPAIQIGDMLEIAQGSGGIHRITGVTVVTNNMTGVIDTVVTLASPVSAAAVTSLRINDNYRFIRQPRPLMGEPPLQLPLTTLIDLSKSINPTASYSGQIDIIFAPSGQVINATGGRIVLWVHDENKVSKAALVTIYCNSGGVALHPEGPKPWPDPLVYQFTQDGLSSGQ